MQELPSQTLPCLSATLRPVHSNPALLFFTHAPAGPHVRVCIHSEGAEPFISQSCRSHHCSARGCSFTAGHRHTVIASKPSCTWGCHPQQVTPLLPFALLQSQQTSPMLYRHMCCLLVLKVPSQHTCCCCDYQIVSVKPLLLHT